MDKVKDILRSIAGGVRLILLFFMCLATWAEFGLPEALDTWRLNA